MLRYSLMIAVCLGLLPLLLQAGQDDEAQAARPPLPPVLVGPVDFRLEVLPILQSRCVSCHGPEKQRSGLRLDSGVEALQGGNSGELLIKGKSEESLLIHLVAGWEPERIMPPQEPRLTADEIGKLRAWIDQGANVPDQEQRSGAVTRTESTHWSFQPIQRPEPPQVRDARSAPQPIDAFIHARLEKEGLAPAAEAERHTLIRRLSLDLLGLPPRPEEVDEFLADTGEGAYERLVDRLLASPHYGERWARHWLDVARYADSDGYEKDSGRPWAWRYRQWVIDAFNRDLPFDQFVIEQLAGDLLPNATAEQRAATGFHRNTLKNLEGGVDQEEFRVAAVVDRVNTTATAFLGLTMACAQCHDHKYDPLTQREFFQFFAFFNRDEEALADAPLPGETAKVAFLDYFHQRQRGWLQARVNGYIQDLLPAAQERWEKALVLPDLRKTPAKIREILLLEPAERTEEQHAELRKHYQSVDAELKKLRDAVAAHDRQRPRVSQAQILKLGPARTTRIHVRGDFLRPGATVAAGVPAVLPPLPSRAMVASRQAMAIDSEPSEPSRLDLAHWLTAADNPLPDRVIVNWVWQHHFGRGLVATPEDFGTRGEPPSHPELLDWLAAEFRAQGRSFKKLHRAIVTSATYRQSATVQPHHWEKDPQNILLARAPRLRLEAEVLRDSALAVSGLLTRRIGGPSVRPPQPAGISDLTYAGSAKWEESKGPDRYRRGLYTWFQRTSPYPMLLNFDAPDSNVCVVRRERSNTPLQALTLLNDAVFVEAAQSLAARLLKDATSDEERVELLMRLCLAREPRPLETRALLNLLTQLRALAADQTEEAAKLAGRCQVAGTPPAEAAAWVGVARTVLNLDEFLTRE